jgi:hypothetical protein
VNDTQQNRRVRVPEGVIDDVINGQTFSITPIECMHLAKRVSELDDVHLANMARLADEALQANPDDARRRDLTILQSFCQAQLVLKMAKAVEHMRESREASGENTRHSWDDSE